MKPYIFAALAIAAVAIAQESPAPDPTPAETVAPDAATAPATTPRKTLEHDGQTFELVNSTATGNVETDEYVPAGETLAEWSQLLTVQRMALQRATPTDEFVAYFQKRLQAEDGATLQTLKQSKASSVFAVRFPKSDKNEEQVMICLAFADPAKAGTMNIIQYAIKPLRGSVNLVEMRIKSWRDRFLRQADAIAAPKKP